MDNKNTSKHPLLRHVEENSTLFLPGYLKYDEREDIYNQGKEEAEIDPEQVMKAKEMKPMV